MSRRVTVLVGTDHHDFSRLVAWADAWQEKNPDDEVLVQHGHSAGPVRAQGVELVPPSELLTLLTLSDVVVTHGGPGTIMSARHAGHHPLAVPRDPARGEHVDRHQMQFVSWAAAKGLCDENVSVEGLTAAVSGLDATGTRTDTHVVLTPEVDDELLERTVSSRRRRRGASPHAVPVLWFAGAAWDPAALPLPTDDARPVVLGEVSALWAGGPASRCSCGLEAGTCPFWSAVAARAFDGTTAGRVRALHEELREHPAAAARRHPGPERRRRYLELALAYRRACLAALQLADADVVVDHGGPLVDVLPLSHCRELDVQVALPPSPDRSERLLLAALRYRGVPTWQPSRLRGADSTAALRSEHQLQPTRGGALHGSITW